MDFLFDQSRSRQFWINASLRHAEFAVLYLKDMRRRSFSMENLVNHIHGAAPTLELQENLANLSFAAQLVEREAHSSIPDFFAAISQWNIDGAVDLYNDQLERFDRFAMGILGGMYYADPCLTALVSIVKLEIDAHPSRNIYILFELFSFHNAPGTLDKLSLSYWAHYSSEYRRFILEFLENHRRCGIYAFTREHYATAAIYFIKYISNHHEQITPSLSTLKRKHIQQKNTPWRWRKIVQKSNSSEAAQVVQWQLLKNPGMSIFHWGNHGLLLSDRAFGLALRCLVHVLPQSASSEELTILASQHKFIPLSRRRPNRKRAVTREIARYLARAEQQRS
ncbi:hypothetical protein GALMADRAFT_149244 [Galerina marginata CBS 339.88]|uniref:Uncharacterized protein n=1 Tax=Galerina marginata (strain CBS 339.88) TaxID=685588 RepID=A0A067S1Z5_GALM3|nr:hypothetical protein GALMADRAFT_149244 [Galerina marginata CBS 339.88]